MKTLLNLNLHFSWNLVRLKTVTEDSKLCFAVMKFLDVFVNVNFLIVFLKFVFIYCISQDCIYLV